MSISDPDDRSVFTQVEIRARRAARCKSVARRLIAVRWATGDRRANAFRTSQLELNIDAYSAADVRVRDADIGTIAQRSSLICKTLWADPQAPQPRRSGVLMTCSLEGLGADPPGPSL
jgi:hypothetical protein